MCRVTDAQMGYSNLAKVEAQFPDVGGGDLYYGGTAYENKGGLVCSGNLESGDTGISQSRRPRPGNWAKANC